MTEREGEEEEGRKKKKEEKKHLTHKLKGKINDVWGNANPNVHQRQSDS